jgi:4-hydroxy-tetrahydrodipicolinate synthase
MLIPQGIIPAMVTPFNTQDEVDEKVLRGLVQRFLKAKVHGLFCLGSNGEFFSLSSEEKVRVAQIVVEETKGEVPVYAGSGGISTREVIQLTRQMASIGVSAVSVITPYFLKLTDKELLFHYEAIAASTEAGYPAFSNQRIIEYDRNPCGEPSSAGCSFRGRSQGRIVNGRRPLSGFRHYQGS